MEEIVIIGFAAITIIQLTIGAVLYKRKPIQKVIKPKLPLDFKKDIVVAYDLIGDILSKEIMLFYISNHDAEGAFRGMNDENFKKIYKRTSFKVCGRLSNEYYEHMSKYMSKDELKEHLCDKTHTELTIQMRKLNGEYNYSPNINQVEE